MLFRWLRQNFFIQQYRLIRQNTPKGFETTLPVLVLLSFVRSVLDLMGMLIILPVIDILLNPSIIKQNSVLRYLYGLYPFPNDTAFTFSLMLVIVFVFILKVFLSFICIRYQTNLYCNMTRQLAKNRFLSFMNASYSYIVERNSASLNRSVAAIPLDYQQRIINQFVAFSNELFLVILITLFVGFYNAVILLCELGLLLPIVLIYNKLFRRRLKELSSLSDAAGKKLAISSQQSMTAYREIVLFKRINYFTKQFLDGFVGVINTYRRFNVMNDILSRITESIFVVAIFFIFLVGYLLHETNAQLIQFLVVFAIALTRLLPSVNRMVSYYNNMLYGQYTFDHIADIPKEIDERVKLKWAFKESERLSFKKLLSLREIDFSYSGNDENVFDRLSLDIRKGETIGIIGSSGSGKTTLINILLRLYEEKKGGIFLDDIKIDNTNISQWYDLISFVPQNIILLDGTILENIAFGIPPDQIDMARVNESAEKAGLSALLNESLSGLETMIGEGGQRISGGQRQRIGIARALFTQAQILIFDEATSALDMDTEKMITDAIRDLKNQELTMIIVAHRYQTLKYCDKIFEIKYGKVERTLTYSELIQSSLA
jgi:ATP-binding cassette, subfamily B, bacterial PglK